MDPLDQIKLRPLMNISTGNPEVTIGVIDGPVYLAHPAFKESRIKTVKEDQLIACKKANSVACIHGTFVVGMLCAMRGLNSPAICPSCRVILYPIFSDDPLDANQAKGTIPSSTPEELSKAIVQTVDAGAKIVNMSLGFASSSLTTSQRLKEAFDYAIRKEVILVVAAGNQGTIGHIGMLDHRWIIPVVSCDSEGRIDSMSNFGYSISRRGLMAPGINIASTAPDGKYTQMSGTSVATPFVSGTIALLWSIFPQTKAFNLIRSLISNGSSNRSIIPKILNANNAYQFLQQMSE